MGAKTVTSRISIKNSYRTKLLIMAISPSLCILASLLRGLVIVFGLTIVLLIPELGFPIDGKIGASSSGSTSIVVTILPRVVVKEQDNSLCMLTSPESGQFGAFLASNKGGRPTLYSALGAAPDCKSPTALSSLLKMKGVVSTTDETMVIVLVPEA